jgi:ribosomal protein L33
MIVKITLACTETGDRKYITAKNGVNFYEKNFENLYFILIK